MWNQVVINLLGRYVLVLCLLVRYIRTYDDGPNWRKILAKFHNKVDDIYGSSTKGHEEAYSGKVFKYVLPEGEDNKDDYEAFEENTGTLPKWLSFESKKRKLHGLPTDEDIRSGIKILFRKKHENTVNGLTGVQKFIMLNVYNNREPFTCGFRSRKVSNGIQSSYAAPSGVITTGSIIFSANISKSIGKKRVKFMRKIAKQLNQAVSDLYLEVGNRLINDVALENGIRLAGPGDQVVNEEPGFTVTWKIKCGRDNIVDENVRKLQQLSTQEDFSFNYKEPVLGWFVHTSDEGSRHRRAIGADRTPSANTPVDGTPTVSPSPSVVVSPSMIKPSKSVTIMKTAAPLAPIVDTTTEILPTTAERTTVSTESTTTEATTTEATTKTTTTTTTLAPEILIKRDIGGIELFEEQAGEVDLRNLFYHPKPLTIALLETDDDKHWIEYSRDKLYISPKSEHVGRHEFVIKASDNTGKHAAVTFTVRVKRDLYVYGSTFNVTLGADYTEVDKSAQLKVKIVKGIADAHDYIADYGSLRRISFSQGSVITVWSLTDSRYSGCRNDDVNEFMLFLQSDKFKNAISFGGVLHVGMVESNICAPPPTAPPTTTPPTTTPAITTTTTTTTTTTPATTTPVTTTPVTTTPVTTTPATTTPATTTPATTTPATSTQDTTIPPPPPIITSATAEPPVTSKTASNPVSKSPIGRIDVFEHQAQAVEVGLFSYHKPLTIELQVIYSDKNKKPTNFDDTSWIEYSNHKLYILPKKINAGDHIFALRGTDNETGKFAMDIFDLSVKEDPRLYNNLFNVTVQKDYREISASARSQVNLIKDIAHASKRDDYTSLRSIAFYKDGTIVWGLEDERYTDCMNEYVKEYMELLQSDEFRSSIASGGVLSVGMIEKVTCVPSIGGVPAAADSNLWQRILIPVIVIVVLLLIIALILCCVYRRKRKATVQIEEDKAYLSHKKPVIFLEEFEEKPHFVSLQPLILPNEKPPTPGHHHYEPRADTPEGPGSSTTVSTESEDKPLTPQSPKDSSRNYNAPPPYNAL